MCIYIYINMCMYMYRVVESYSLYILALDRNMARLAVVLQEKEKKGNKEKESPMMVQGRYYLSVEIGTWWIMLLDELRGILLLCRRRKRKEPKRRTDRLLLWVVQASDIILWGRFELFFRKIIKTITWPMVSHTTASTSVLPQRLSAESQVPCTE